MMTAEWPGEVSRRQSFHRLLDTLAAVPPRRRPRAIQTLGLRLTARQQRLLLALVAVWQESENAEYQPTVPPRGDDAL